MQILKFLVEAISALLIVASLIPLIHNDYWIFRVFEFPRFQKLILSILMALVLFFGFSASLNSFSGILSLLLVANTLYLTYQVFPFTRASKKQVLRAKHLKQEQCITLLTANVYQYNRNYQDCLRNIASSNPDVVLLLETDDGWQEATSSLREDYPHGVTVPLPNTYGMLFYSRYPLTNYSIEYLVEKDVPSIHAVVEIPCGKKVQLFCVHPTPPVPGENPRSTERDKELLLVAELARESRLPVIVIGDLNDVAWSYTTELFCKISGLLDPRRGRGFFNTFHARHPLLRFPLDHIFCSVDFKLIHLGKLPAAGSDHFPMYAKLQYEEVAAIQQEQPLPDQDDLETAAEKISKETA